MLDGYGCNDDCSFYDGDNDNYHFYEPNLGGVYSSGRNSSGRTKSHSFVKNSDYYHGWEHFAQIIERDNCYSFRIGDVWMNIPKKIVREVRDDRMLVHKNIFCAIETATLEKYFRIT